jgi:hypothetical protein
MEIIREQTCSVREQKPIRKYSKSSFCFETESSGPEVLVVHEDLPTGLRASAVFQNVEYSLGIETRLLINNWWRFAMLQDAESAESALQQAKRADIVFLAMHSDRNLPTDVRNWLLKWLGTKDHKPCVLVVSLDSSTRDLLESNSTFNFLREITAPLEVDLLLHLGWTPLMVRDGAYIKLGVL